MVKEYQTFIVRIWADEASEVARGHIQHVRTRRTLYFQDAARMLHFIDEHLAPLSLSGLAGDPTTLAETASVDQSQALPGEGLLAENLSEGVLPRRRSGDVGE